MIETYDSSLELIKAERNQSGNFDFLYELTHNNGQTTLDGVTVRLIGRRNMVDRQDTWEVKIEVDACKGATVQEVFSKLAEWLKRSAIAIEDGEADSETIPVFQTT